MTKASSVLNLARQVLHVEAQAIEALAATLNEDFLAAIELILKCNGRVIVSGIGKSGHIARKIASTFASTGTPAFFVHPAEASHGDLGMIARNDIFIALSYSGESEELLRIVPLVKRQGASIIVMSGKPESSLAREADIHLNASVAQEACPLGLAPTASTTASLALGDALAVALLDARGFGAEDFARSHPGGALGRRLLTHVRDVMRHDAALPRVLPTTTISEAILEISRGGIGMTAVVDTEQAIVGIFTDGDLRRAFERNVDLRHDPVSQVMTQNPRTIGPEQLAVEAVEMMERFRINQLLVVDEKRHLLGALNMHDLFNAKVI